MRICSLAFCTFALSAAALSTAGCAALDPIQGHTPAELAYGLTSPTECRDCTRTIDLSRLEQPRPSEHLVGPGDTLGIFVEGVLGEEDKAPIVIAPATDQQQPKLGTPIKVRRDGTILLPFLDGPIAVAGRSVPAVERLVREAYTSDGGFIRPGGERIFVQLLSPRVTRVLVVRRDRPNQPELQNANDDGRFTRPTRGTSQLVELPAFENDVLHALVASGGLPGPEAENAVYIMRASRRARMTPPSQPARRPQVVSPTPADPEPLPAIEPSASRGPILPIGYSVPANRSPAALSGHNLGSLLQPRGSSLPSGTACSPGYAAAGMPLLNTPKRPALSGGHSVFAESPRAAGPLLGGHSVFAPEAAIAARTLMTGDPQSMELAQALRESPHVTRIPLEAPCGAPYAFAPSDVLLQDGDVVFIESREREFFYTAGLLGGGKYSLPREESLDVLDAIALVDSQRRQLPGRFVGGVSSLSQDVSVGASQLVIYRKVAGGTVPIALNLNTLKKNPSQAITIRPGDRLFLQYTRCEMIAASFERFFIEGAVLGLSSSAAFGN